MRIILYSLLFIGLILLPYLAFLAFRAHSDKKFRKWNEESDRKVNEVTALLNKMEASFDLAQELRSKCLDKAGAEEVYQELHKDLVSVFGDDYRSKFILPMYTENWYMASNHSCWAWRLLLARRGYIDKMTYHTGISIGGETDYDWQIKFCKLIERYLMDKHPEEGENVQFAVKPKPDISYSPIKNEVKNVMNPYGRYGINVTLWKFVPEGLRRRPWSERELFFAGNDRVILEKTGGGE